MRAYYVLGINESRNATAALTRDGELIACASEERFTRIKNQSGFPRQAIDFCLATAGITIKDVKKVVFAAKHPALAVWYRRSGSAWARRFQRISVFTGALISDLGLFWPSIFLINQWVYRSLCVFYRLTRPLITWRHRQHLAYLLGISTHKMFFMDHHLAHAWAALAFVPAGKHLVVTNDGAGDEVCGRVWVVGKKWREIASTPNRYSLAYIYYYITKYLGFTPDQDEYKVMGLAPYAKNEDSQGLYPVLARLIWLKGLSFGGPIERVSYESYLRLHLTAWRFDTIAATVQKLTEILLEQQITRAVKKTGLGSVVLGGGLAMNIKANLVLAELPRVSAVSVCPSAGDESGAIGAAFWGYGKLMAPVKNINLGPSFSESDITAAIKSAGIGRSKNYYITRLRPNRQATTVARLLVRGEIVARFAGRMEFGARALGNRSILADPRRRQVAIAINEKIKQRDFWMPFAPTILAEYASEYLINPKRLASPFMMLAFRTTAKGKKDLAAAIHPADGTCRPQILRLEDNPDYYRLIERFAEITGVAALLNTSFNLHGEPIVCSPADALSVFQRSGLQFLWLEDYLIEKRPEPI